MDLILYFGDFLSEKIGIPPVAARGLIRFSLKDEVGSSENLNYDVLLKTFKNSLKSRLERIGIENRDKVSNDMIKELRNKQSLFTMSTV
jgi:hypothetical protein